MLIALSLHIPRIAIEGIVSPVHPCSQKGRNMFVISQLGEIGNNPMKTII